MKNNVGFSTLCYLGSYLRSLSQEDLQDLGEQANRYNGWFTPQQVIFTLKHWAEALSEVNLRNWLSAYTIKQPAIPKKVGIIMAGNIPLVGFHDLTCVLATGHIACCKFSSQDSFLPQYMVDKMIELEPAVADQIEIRERLNHIDAIIATGSNNSARYFEYYFGKLPNIIRKNRSSCAILTGNERNNDLQKLGLDMLQYYGLGCRSVSKLLVPKDYTFTKFFEAIETYQNITNNHKWVNNYDYHKSIYLVNSEAHLDNGFLLLKEDKAIGGPVSVIFYEHYNNLEEAISWTEEHAQELQCIVGAESPASIPFGKAQQPDWQDYADGVDTIDFLQGI